MLGGNPKLFKLDNILISTSYGVKKYSFPSHLISLFLHSEVRKACEELLRTYESLDCYNIPNRTPFPFLSFFKYLSSHYWCPTHKSHRNFRNRYSKCLNLD